MKLEVINSELNFKTSRSSGAGGQNVNKVSTKVALYFNVVKSEGLSEAERVVVLKKLDNRITIDGFLILQCDETRSQLKNKEIVFKRLVGLLKEALKPVKKRKPTKPSKSAKRKRLDAKKKHSLKKESRRFNPKKD